LSEIVAYLDATKLALISSPVIADFAIIKERVTATDGYVRLRATLINGDFLELTEYFVRIGQRITTVDYRYQW
jgi:type IV secretory pathway TrbF-like protein